MYRVASAGRQPMLLWAVSEPKAEHHASEVRCLIFCPAGQNGVEATSGSVALRSLVDSAVMTIQAKYSERAETIAANFHEIQTREDILEEMRVAFMDTITGPQKDSWSVIEKRVMGSNPRATILDKDAAMQPYMSMKTYLATKHATANDDDAYEVHTDINMTRVHTHSDAECMIQYAELQTLALRMLVATDSQKQYVFANKTQDDSVDNPSLMLKMYMKPLSIVGEKTAASMVRGMPRYFYKTDSGKNESFSPFGDDFSSSTDIQTEFALPLAVQHMVMPSLAIGMRNGAMESKSVESVMRMLTSHDPFLARTITQEEFSHCPDPTPRPSEARQCVATLRAILRTTDLAKAGLRDGYALASRRAEQRAEGESPSSLADAVDIACGLEAFASSVSPGPKPVAEYFRLVPVESSAPITPDGIVEFDVATAWSAGHGPSAVCDAFEGVQAFLRSKYVRA